MSATFQPRKANYSSRSGTNLKDGLRCPRCGGVVVRVPRHAFDRLISLFSRRHRFRCTALGCEWEGSLRAKH